ncbi:MAG: MFS transporter, partial [Terracidiphilus sp.]
MRGASAASGVASRLRWTMIALAFFATLINYLDRQALSVAAPILRAQFHLSNIDYSRILFAFMLAYTIMNGFSGLLIDRLGTRAGYALFVGWWSLCALLHAFARGALSLGVFRFLLGMGEAGNWPAAVRVVAEWFPAEERSFASGIFNSGSSVGAILAPPVIAVLLLRYGWRSAFVAVGCAGFVWLVAWMRLYRPPVRTAEEPVLQPEVPLRRLFHSRFLWSFTLSKIFVDPAWYFYIFWFPEYLFHSRNFDMASIGRYAWIPFFVAGLG